MKKKTRKAVSLDTDLVLLADKEISNLSEFFNNVLRAYFSTGDLSYDDLQYQYLSNNRRINECRVNNVLIRAKLNELEETIESSTRDKGMVWRKVWTPFSTTETIDPVALSEAVNVLGYDESELKVILENSVVYCEDNDCYDRFNDWDMVVECVL